MRAYDFSPLYRSAVGFDRLATLLETAARTGEADGWPPYNIETTGENAYRIEIAVAGFPRRADPRGEGKPADRHRSQDRQ